MIKKVIKGIIRILIPRERIHYKIIKHLSKILNDISIYDLGASYFYHKRFEVFYRSRNTILNSVDPNAKNLSYLDDWRFESEIKIHPFAVGGKNEVSILNITKIDSGSSLLNFDFNNNNEHRIVKNNLLPIKKKKIKLKSFNDIFKETIRENDLAIFKIDIQGTELDVLESIIDVDLKKKILCVEVESGIAKDPVNHSEKGIIHLFNYFDKIDFEIIDVKVVRYLLPKANKILKTQNVPKECDWVFMKKFSHIIKQNVDYQITAVACYISYNLYGEAIEIIRRLLKSHEIDSRRKTVLEKVLKLLI